MDLVMAYLASVAIENPITVEELQIIIREHDQDDTFTIKSTNNTKAMGVGDNCLADVFRVKINGESKKNGEVTEVKKSVIVKKAAKDEINIPPEIFKFESSVYNNVLETLEVALGEKLPVIRCIKATEDVVITEDFKDEGWALTKRSEGLNQDQAAQVVKSLAKFHAASIILSKTDNSKFKKLSEHVQDQVYSDSAEKVCKKTLGDAYAIAKHNADKYLPKASQKEAEAIKKYFVSSSDEIYELAKTATKETPESAQVLVHGNCWANNFMLKKAGGHALLINMSTVCLASPARDLVYLFATNPQELDKTVLTNLYVEELHKHLNKQKMSSDVIKQFSMDFIQAELKRLEVVARLTAIWLLVTMSHFTFPTVEEYNKTDLKDKAELMSKYIDNDFYNSRLIKILLEYAGN